MVDQPGNPVPMCDWEEVSAMSGARRLLKCLTEGACCHLATNSATSTRKQVHKALLRVGLERYISNIYCYRETGLKKPSREFFDFIIRDLAVNKADVVMIGDELEKDIFGALDSGIQAIWYNPGNLPAPGHILTVTDLSDLLKVL